MRVKRILLGAVLTGWFGGSAFAQPKPDGLFPPGPPTAEAAKPWPQIAPASSPVTPATAPAGNPEVAPPASPTATLTGMPATGDQLPRGSYAGPWCGDQRAGCAGPWGKNGPVSYEIYSNTGVSFPFTGGAFIGTLNAGVMTGGGGRSLLFDKTGERAWVIDLGLSYTINEGSRDRILQVYTPQATDQNGNLNGPDQVNSYRLRSLHRTSFNFALGRDWWLNGPGNLTETSGPNWRAGADVGGRWGTAHVDLIPVGDQFNYFRRQAVFHGFFLSSHLDCEVPMGGWILFGGVRGQWGYDFMNIIPPMDGDVQSFNVLLTLGVRF